MTSTVRCLLLIGLAVAASQSGMAKTLSAPGQQAPRVIEILERYASGDFDTALAALRALDDVDEARKDLALDFANARMNDEWKRLRSLIKWGCDLLREGAPTEGERLWHLASVGLAQAARDWAVLYRSPPPVRLAACGHLDHAVSRFPNDARLAFADTVVLASRNGSGLPPQRGTDAPRSSPPPESIQRVLEIIGFLQDFADDALVRDEAELRTGLAWLGIGRVDDALRHFELASRGTNPWSAYLAHVFGAQIQDRAGATEAAMAQYRAALAVLPHTQSAAFGLAALLIDAGQPDEAYALTQQALVNPVPADPWRIYGLGDYRHFPEYVQRLREAIGR